MVEIKRTRDYASCEVGGDEKEQIIFSVRLQKLLSIKHLIHTAQPDGNTLIDEIKAWITARLKKSPIKEAVE
jgi:hypothetical protein